MSQVLSRGCNVSPWRVRSSCSSLIFPCLGSCFDAVAWTKYVALQAAREAAERRAVAAREEAERKAREEAEAKR